MQRSLSAPTIEIGLALNMVWLAVPVMSPGPGFPVCYIFHLPCWLPSPLIVARWLKRSQTSYLSPSLSGGKARLPPNTPENVRRYNPVGIVLHFARPRRKQLLWTQECNMLIIQGKKRWTMNTQCSWNRVQGFFREEKEENKSKSNWSSRGC